MNQVPAIKKKRRTSRQPPHVALLHDRMAQLRQVERRMDGLFQQILDDLTYEGILRACDRFDELVSTFPALRLPTLAQYPDQARALLSYLDLEKGPSAGFGEAMDKLWELCVTPQAIRGLHSRMYSVAAQVAETWPELLPTVAIAALWLDAPNQTRNSFLDMVVCASAIEWLLSSSVDDDVPVSLDVSSWLAAEPSDALLAAVGEGRAYYYAPLPGVFPFLNQRSVLFDVQRLVPYARSLSQPCDRYVGPILNRLVDSRYRATLRAELRRVQNALRQQYEDRSIADVVMLTDRAMAALDDLPPQVNPLLQAILVQSWVRYLHELC